MLDIHTVPNNVADKVFKWVSGTKIPWFYFSNTLGNDRSGASDVDQDTYIITDMPRFTHYFYPNSKTPKEDIESVGLLTEWVLKNILPNYQVMRLQGNMTTQLPDAEKLLNIPHIDSANPAMMTFLYYVNTSDGDTVFFNNKLIHQKVSPIKGTGALFPSNTVHAGQVPCINKNRYVINMLFRKRD